MRRRPGSVRLRVTAAAVVAVALVLVVGGVTIVRAQRSALTEDIDDALIALAGEVQAGLDQPLPDALTVKGDDDTAAQVVGGDGEVVSSTANIRGAAPLAAAPGRDSIVTVDGLPHDSARFRLLSRPVELPSGESASLFLAASLDDVDESVAALVKSLRTTAPIVLAALAAVVWWVVGRTLRPVEEANRRQQRFVADASHELRSPLTRIRAELEVDLAHPGHADPWATHRSVLEEAERLQRLVDDLLYTARTDAGAAASRRTAVDLDDLVLAEAERVRAGGRVSVDLAGVSAAQVMGDRTELGRVVRNLADNAGRHARSRVAFSVAEVDGAAVVAIADDGPGIPPADRERVFERFARVDAARSAGEGGTGLGLAIAREIVERHGGAVVVDSDYTSGARLVVTLPSGTGRPSTAGPGPASRGAPRSTGRRR